MIIGYDLDGTLAEGPAPSEKKWGLMKGHERIARRDYLIEHYGKAQKILDPKEDQFYIITARKKQDPIVAATRKWILKHFPGRVLETFFLESSRTIENVVKFKSKVINNLSIDVFYEDNARVLKGLKKHCPMTTFYVVEKTLKGMTISKF